MGLCCRFMSKKFTFAILAMLFLFQNPGLNSYLRDKFAFLNISFQLFKAKILMTVTESIISFLTELANILCQNFSCTDSMQKQMDQQKMLSTKALYLFCNNKVTSHQQSCTFRQSNSMQYVPPVWIKTTVANSAFVCIP